MNNNNKEKSQKNNNKYNKDSPPLQLKSPKPNNQRNKFHKIKITTLTSKGINYNAI